jgi:hypothetical protein
MPLAQRGAQDGVHESGRAGLLHHPRQVHGIVNDGGGRDPIEVQELVEAEAKDREDARIQFREGALREMLDEVIEGALPSERAGDDGRRERAVAVVGECGAAGCERSGEVGPVGRDCDEGVKSRRPRRRRQSGSDPVLTPF